jgi:voltage-gated sodium channel
MSTALRRLADTSAFQGFVTAVIVLAGVVVGMETYPTIQNSIGPALHLINQIILGIFILEVMIKIGAEGSRPWRYFQDPWNVFDFSIVAASLLPFGGGSVAVVRLLRLLRVLRLLKAVPRLQLLVNALLKSIPSMFYVSLLLMLLFYVYAVASTLLFGANDPIHFSSLHLSMVSLFRAVTLEDWTDLMYIQMYGCDHYGYDGNEALCTAPHAMPVLGALFFISFVLLGTMVFLNLFIGVILSGMDSAQKEADRQAIEDLPQGVPSTLDDVVALQGRLTELQVALQHLQRRLEVEHRQAEAASRDAADAARV